MRRIPLLALVLVALLLSAPATYAAPITFVANLNGATEVPPNASPGTGFATVVLDPAANTLHVQVSFSGLLAGTTASHIHCCLPSPFAAANAMVATTTPTFPGFPSGVTSGTYDHVLNLLDSASYNPAFITAEGGTVAGAEAALVAGIEAGETYLNIHTTMFPGGEIRGFLVPEPATMLLFGTGLAGLGGIAWKRRRWSA